MKMALHRFIAFLSLVSTPFIVHSHPTKYPHVEANREQLKLKLKEDGEPPPIISWHAHITYFLTQQSNIQGAMDLRAKTADYFAPFLGEECDGRYDNGVLCMINDHNFWNETLEGGPFPVGEWSIFIPVPYYSLVVPWLLQHRGAYSMVIHPNTGFEYEDHSIWASWSGIPQPLDMSIFQENTQTEDFGHWRGDDGNPTCMAATYVCGSTLPAYNSTTSVLCCPGLACDCGVSDDEDFCRCK
jgi:aromatic ring-cleaving dioxygenase